MIRLIAVAGFLAFATSAQAITPAPLPQPDGMITQIRLGCGPFRTRVNGVCGPFGGVGNGLLDGGSTMMTGRTADCA